MNKVIMMGRLTKDPEYRQTQDGKGLTRFSIAVDRKTKEKVTDFFNCTAFGKTAEFAETYLKKGTKIVLDGKVQNDSYTNKDGKKVTTTVIIVDELEFAESKEKESTDKPEQKTTDWMPASDLADDELPFKF